MGLDIAGGGSVSSLWGLVYVAACLDAASLLVGLSWYGEGGFVFECRNISKTSLPRWGCDRISSVPSTLGLSFSTINSCNGFVLGI